MERKILVAVDGSPHSFCILRYLGHLFKNVKTIGFHLLCVVSAGEPNIGQDWLNDQELLNALPAEARKRWDHANLYMAEAVLQLARCGIDPDQVATDIRLKQISIAADILQEARKGDYDALLLGRRGLSKIEALFMGSVSKEIIAGCHDLPVWMIDGQVHSHKFLVPIDGTVPSLRAVDHLAFILRDNPYAEITLFHSSALLASSGVSDVETCQDLWGKEWCELHLSSDHSLFHAPEQLLLESNIPRERIHRLHTRRGIHPSRQILRQAMVDEFGTIVMGRRGKEDKKGLLGSVSDPVLLMAEGLAVWVVG
ncbi:MAG: universal stress protein [Desulfobulbaceae bacterium]|nr:universal stress protein [Desulfobulbaceae bacterium]